MKFIIIPVKYKSDETIKLEKEFIKTKKEQEKYGYDKDEIDEDSLNEKILKTAIFVDYRLNIELIINYNLNLNEETFIEIVNGPLITSLSEEKLDELINKANNGHNTFTSYKDLKNELPNNK